MLSSQIFDKKNGGGKVMKSAFNIILLLLIIILTWSSVRPFWTKYWVGEDIETAAIYGTKNSIEDTKKFLIQKMTENGRNFVGDDFNIEKNKDNTVNISITYTDKISFFGVSLKPLEFTLRETAREIKEKF
jgi:hypothetical protein